MAFFWSTSQSIETEVGRPVRSTDVHKCAQPLWLVGRSTDPVDHPESCALWIWPRSTRRSTGRSKPRHGRPGGRPTGCNGQKFDRWPVDRPQHQLLSWPATASFWEPIKWDSLGLFSIRFQESFCASFSYLSKCLSPLILEQILPYQKESFQEWFSKEFS